jgi:hypothetical protein
VLIGTLFLISQTASQEILRIIEKDQDSSTFLNPRNVDINSQLVLELDTANLLKKLSSSGAATPIPEELMALLETLQAALQKRDEWIERFRRAVAEYVRGKRQDFERFNATRQQVAIEILSLLQRDEKLLVYFEQEDSVNPWQQLTNAITRRIEDLQRNVLLSTAFSDYRLRLGGWIIRSNGSTPLHFEGLDANPVGEFYEVERWRFLPTAEQLAQLEQAQELAKTSGDNEINMAEFLRSRYVQVFTKELEENVKKGLADLREEADKVVADLGVAVIKTDVDEVLVAGNSFRDLLMERVEFYVGLKTNPSFTLSMLLGTLPNDLNRLNQHGDRVKTGLQKLQQDLSELKGALKQKAGQLPQLATEQLKVYAETVLGRDLLDMLAGSSRIDEATLAFSNQVFSLAFKDFPSQSITDLRSAGFRGEGDRVLIRLAISRGEGDNRLLRESKDLRLYRILPHTESTVGVIFAHPLSTTAIQREFQMAPYFNLLFKGIFGASQKWKRRSSLPNTLLDLSFGLHVSSPDFDKDDVPELGVGIVGSTLQDYLQFGWAYNVFTSTPYLYFGIRLPIPNLSSNANTRSSDQSIKE